MTAFDVREVPRIAVGALEAAASLGMSRRHFEEHVASELRCIRVGRRKLYRIAELERWAESRETGGSV